MNVAAAEITRCVLERDDKVRILDADALLTLLLANILIIKEAEKGRL